MKLCDSSMHRELAIAEAAARQAGATLLAGAARLCEIEFLSASDVKLRADRESEEQIRHDLAAAFRYPVYGEELGGDEGLLQRNELYWVVDPLDGTFNYLRGNPSCAVSIGLMRGETPVLGVIYDFSRDECFAGVTGEGFWINGRRVQPAWADSLGQAALVTGFPSGMDSSPAVVQAFLQRIAPFKKVRMIGSAALALAYVAAGRADVYYEESIRLWDVAAGLAMVQAAGGAVRMRATRGGKVLAYDICAAHTRFLHAI